MLFLLHRLPFLFAQVTDGIEPGIIYQDKSFIFRFFKHTYIFRIFRNKDYFVVCHFVRGEQILNCFYICRVQCIGVVSERPIQYRCGLDDNEFFACYRIERCACVAVDGINRTGCVCFAFCAGCIRCDFCIAECCYVSFAGQQVNAEP